MNQFDGSEGFAQTLTFVGNFQKLAIGTGLIGTSTNTNASLIAMTTRKLHGSTVDPFTQGLH
jgi:hypothetical protein